MKMTPYAVLLLALLSRLTGAGAERPSFEPPRPEPSHLTVDLREVIEPVNRRVMGVCLIYWPLDAAVTKFCAGVLDGASGRAWAHLTTETHWNSFMPFVREVGLSEVFAVDTHCSHPQSVVRYAGPNDNNLARNQLPGVYAAELRKLNKTPHAGFPHGYGVTGWEVWNEPQFPQNGAWPPDDYARFVVDCSKALRAVQPDIQVGACLHEGDMDWNRRMLRRIAATDIGAINFVITHAYDFSWISAQHRMGTYYARVSGSERLRSRVRDKVRLAQQLGHGRWRVAVTEWNTHPVGYGPPYHLSTDMAAAVNIAGMFDVFWNEGVDAATFFHLLGRDRGEPRHFALIHRSDGGLELLPTGEVFFLYGRYFRGDRLRVHLKTPTYPYDAGETEPAVRVPVVIAHAAYQAPAERLTLILSNRHAREPAPVAVQLTRFSPSTRYVRRIVVSAEGPESMKATRRETEEKLLPLGPDPTFTVELPPHSATCLLVDGAVPPDEDELFSQRMEFLREWMVGDVLPPPAAAHHGLDAPLPEAVTRPRQVLRATSGGFVNLASLLERTGESRNLKEGYQAVASAWVFSPVQRKVGVSVGFDYWGLVSVNGERLLEVRQRRGPPQPDTHRARVTVSAGWNLFQVRVASGSKGMGFWFGVEKTGDLQFAASPRRPPWPTRWRVAATAGADVNAFKTFRDTPRPARNVLEIARHPRRIAFVRWTLHPWPGHARGFHARVRLSQAYVRGDGKVWLRPVLGQWDEASLCFDNQPPLGPPLPVVARAQDKVWTFQGKEIDALVQKWLVQPDRNYGLAVGTDLPGYAAFKSDEDPRDPPLVIIERKGK